MSNSFVGKVQISILKSYQIHFADSRAVVVSIVQNILFVLEVNKFQ